MNAAVHTSTSVHRCRDAVPIASVVDMWPPRVGLVRGPLWPAVNYRLWPSRECPRRRSRPPWRPMR